MTTCSISPLRQRMMEDMNARKLSTGTQKGHLRACRRFAAFLKRSPDTASSEDIRRFQLHLAQSGVSISKRNRTMTGLRFLFRVTLRRLDLAADIYHIREPRKIPLVISTDEAKRLLAVAKTLRLRVLLSLAYGCGLRAGEVVRLRAGDIDSAQSIIRVVQAKGRSTWRLTVSAARLRRRIGQSASRARSKPSRYCRSASGVHSAATRTCSIMSRPWSRTRQGGTSRSKRSSGCARAVRAERSLRSQVQSPCGASRRAAR